MSPTITLTLTLALTLTVTQIEGYCSLGFPDDGVCHEEGIVGEGDAEKYSLRAGINLQGEGEGEGDGW